MTAADLRVGDCFDLKDPAADEIDDVTAGPCTAAHEFEMFFVGIDCRQASSRPRPCSRPT